MGATDTCAANGALIGDMNNATAHATGSGAKTFRFRLRIRRDESYPYSLGYSPIARVRVLP